MKKIHIDLANRSYDILIGDKLLDNPAKYIKDVISPSKIIIVSDNNVSKLYLTKVATNLQNHYQNVETIVIPAGEEQKSFVGLAKLTNQILALKPDRNCCLIALGGGVIGDLVGFAASIILRGINFIQIPTSLLAQVDSSVGGKTGINTNHGKNLIGSFKQPKLVIIDYETVYSLSEREYLCGYVEACKYGLINDASFFEFLEKNNDNIKNRNPEILTKIITHSCLAKADIVAKDEEEKSGMRALLNLGHTFGHALEKAAGYGDILKHGEAVAYGIILAFAFSEKQGICKPGRAERIKKHFDSLNINTNLHDLKIKLDAKMLLEAMFSDKKNSNGEINLILAKDIGESYLAKNVSAKEILSFLEESLETKIIH